MRAMLIWFRRLAISLSMDCMRMVVVLRSCMFGPSCWGSCQSLADE
jgi:hypothetical protein